LMFIFWHTTAAACFLFLRNFCLWLMWRSFFWRF
jgi:hypothetical protein